MGQRDFTENDITKRAEFLFRINAKYSKKTYDDWLTFARDELARGDTSQWEGAPETEEDIKRKIVAVESKPFGVAIAKEIDELKAELEAVRTASPALMAAE